MPPGLATVLKRRRRWAKLNRIDYLRSRDFHLRRHLRKLDEYRSEYRQLLILFADKARERIVRDSKFLLETHKQYIAKGIHPDVVKVLTEADSYAMRQTHAREFRLNIRQERLTRFQGLLILPLMNSWQDCHNLKLEQHHMLSCIQREREGLLAMCTQLRTEHRKPLRMLKLF